MGTLILVTGGARSGKSRFAETLAAAADGPVVYLATMEALDTEVEARIARHRERRPSAWTTIEAPRHLPEALAALDGGALVLLDCVSLWITNELIAAVPNPDAAWSAFEPAVDACLSAAGELIAAQERRQGTLIAVTNEAGSGIVPAGPLSRAFRDALGLANQELAAAASEVHLLVSGLPLRLK